MNIKSFKNLHQYSILLYHPTLWVWLFLTSILSIIDIPANHIFEFTFYQIVCYVFFVGAFKATLILFLCSLINKYTNSSFGGCFIIICFSALSIINAFCYKFYDIGITRKFILIIAQTTGYETRDFIPSIIRNIVSIFKMPVFYISILIFVLLVFLFNRLTKKIYLFITGSAALIGLVLFFIFSLNHTTCRSAHFLSLRLLKYSHETYLNSVKFNQLVANTHPFPESETVSSQHLANNVIIVIGESASRDHLSIYGYPLKTSPMLEAKKDTLYILKNAIGSSASTAGNMERILTFKKDDSISGNAFEYPALIDLFNHAGYKTFWLSNQEQTGLVSNTAGVLTRKASVINYVGANCSEDVLQFRHDDILLPHIRKALADTTSNKLICVHLIGSHVNYKSRYPSNRNHISPAEELSTSLHRPWLDNNMAKTVAEYDNSIIFTDSILSVIIDETAQNTQPSVLLYFSDHGENVYDNGTSTGRGIDFVKIPFIIYANRKYRLLNPQLTARIEDAIEKPVTTANIVYPLMTLTGTTYSYYDSINDFMSVSFKSRPRFVDEAVWKHDME